MSAIPMRHLALCDKATLNAIQTLTSDLASLAQSIFDIRNDPEAIAHTHNQVIVALATLQSSVQDLSRAYIQHANTVLTPGKHGLTPIDSNLTSILTESGLLTGRPADAAPAAAEPEGDGKKKRKRTPHDPNAPKRALTPYFLYMQSARATIAKELGDSAKPKEVADEGTRRWTEMSPAEKSVWDDKYQKNLAAYRVKMAAYKAGQPVPSDEEAARLVEMGKAPDHVAGVDAEAETEDEPAAPAETSDESSPEPVREPTPPKSKRRKTKDATPSKPTPKAEAKSPEKKGKKGKKENPSAPASSSKTEKSRKAKK
ncbi:uncharacterized protein Z518_09874 [Rhinocladiella mackenziei CBS 650.93]|uniref:Rhinocladiella mackenziei CBS 650.93 unplaced genomic scaffold supercont1.8, whole genome shotgun sequence n=1 Tax=Rhinocladiella mackenziei CBS 650.93 TaxID=1442369 RepID=A0A0D2I4S6_9EURO|nr:uncharacterized protein Z518_09874 [Rhinocladiella mackenziei CBS 650.93]KIX00809.1 hypothetical protein Z518_09874 [Rhinocladiella mackenziei CBS 650.93]